MREENKRAQKIAGVRMLNILEHREKRLAHRAVGTYQLQLFGEGWKTKNPIVPTIALIRILGLLLRRSHLRTKAIRVLEFFAKLGRLQVFAQVCEALFEGVDGGSYGFGVGMRYVAPHGIGAGSEARHLAEGAA